MDSSNSIDYLEKKLEKLEFHFIKTFASLHQSTEVICADHLFNVFREFLENLDNLLRRASRKISLECNRDIQKLLFVLSSLFPYGDYRLIRLLLDLLQKFRSNESQEIIVDNLPRIFTAAFQGRCRSINESEKILIDMAMNMVASTLNRLDHLPLLIAPVIECLSLLPHSDEGKERFLDIIQSSLPDTPQQDFPRCVRVMLNNISEAEDASSVVTILRQELIRRQASDSSGYVCQTTMFEVLEVVIFALIPSMKYPMWAAPYFKIIEKQRLDTDIAFLPCDLAVFVILSQENQFASVSEEVVHSWLLSGKFPFDTLSNLVDLISRRKPGDSSLLSSPLVYERLAAPLIRLSLLLLISRVKVKCYVNTAKKVDDFILYFYRQLIYSHQRELIKELLQLSEESITFFSGLKCNVNNSQRKKLKLKPPNVLSFSDSRRIIHQSVNALLRKLADKYPETLVQFKMDFVRLLQSPIDNSNIEMNNITSNEQSAGDLCHILLRIFDSDQTNIYPGCIHFAKAELLLLIQNMLFSPCETSKTVFTSTNEQSSIRGIMIATALVRSNELSATENISVRDWILQTILPNTRQMVRPGVGCLCLRFLKIWKDLEIDSGNIFHYLQNILSNTGLIQKNIIHCPDSIIAFNYSNTNVVIESAEKIDSCGDFMFCINFFLRHNQLGNPEEWMTAVNWVFDLVDTYLRIGRQRSKNWKPNRWLKASIEFPALSTGTWANGSSNVISAIHWLKLNLCQFDCYDSHQQIDGINKIVETLSTLDFKLFGKVRVSLFQFRLSLLLGSSVSAAVLRNAYGHSNTNSTKTDHSCHSNSSNDSFELIKLQLTKIYNLQAKSLLMDDLLSSLATNLCQQKSKIYCESRRDDPKKHSSPSVLEGKVTKEISLEFDLFAKSFVKETRLVQGFNPKMYYDVAFIDTNVLWCCLMDPFDLSRIRKYLEYLKQKKQPKIKEYDVLMAVRLKCNIIKHVTYLITNNSCTFESLGVDKSIFWFCLEEAITVADTLPTLHRIMFFIGKTEQCSEDPVAMYAALLSMGVLYIRLLSAFFTKCSHTKTSSYSDCLGWCEQCPVILDRLPYIPHVVFEQEPHINALFNIFVVLLQNSSDPAVADAILEMISIIALQGTSSDLLHKTISLSWVSLHTVYGTSIMEYDHASLPFAFHEAIKDKQTDSVHPENFLNASNELGENRGSNLFHLRQSILRHWGLICASRSGITRLIDDFSIFIAELAKFLDLFNHDCKKFGMIEHAEKKRKLNYVPSIVGLDQSTFPSFFEWMIQLIPGICEVSTPDSCDKPELGPYYRVQRLLQLYHKLTEIYIVHFALFPKKSAARIYCSSKILISTVKNLLNRCISWRAEQPLIPVELRMKGTIDSASLIYLQNLVNSISSFVVTCIISICDKWSCSDSLFRSESTSLKLVAAHTENYLNEVAELYGFERFTSNNVTVQVEDTTSTVHETKGFHQLTQITIDEVTMLNGCDEMKEISELQNFAIKIDDVMDTAMFSEDDDDDEYGIQGYGLNGWIDQSSN